ncbi:DUF2513 domain-containing protein [Hyphobacterium indicum]|uniref:DUF2513 domain-containing protein n=1 Tax=Hyphobacterium indicum TaxID=2162714 RepID=UPI000D65D269|nr:DUF2513 domain-containing protein [Hyphobacterium indicum]
MKMDLELVRQILLKAEAEMPANQSITWSESDFPDHDIPVVGAHVELMMEGGLLRDEKLSWMEDAVFVQGVTYDGYQYLEAVRDADVWERTKDVAEKGKGFSVDVLRDVAISIIKKQISNHTGLEF